MSAVVVQSATGGCSPQLRLTERWHAEVCRRQGLAYRTHYRPVVTDRHPVWDKVVRIREALAAGYELVIWLDADTLIVRPETPLVSALPQGYVGMVANQHGADPWHLNAGCIWTRNTPAARHLWEHVWEHPPAHPWEEQEALNRYLRATGYAGVELLRPHWNCRPYVNSVPHPIIRVWHGWGSLEERRDRMERTMRRYGLGRWINE